MVWLILLLVLVAVVIGVVVLAARLRSTALRERFGAEYDRAVEQHGDRRKAEAGLRAVAKRRVTLDIRPLSDQSRDRYQLRWRDSQARFVDAPVRAVAEADSLVGQVLRERGYPTGDYDEQVAMVAADHGDRADDYRRAFAIHRGVAGPSSTDDLREAFLCYRAVFQALVADTADGTDGTDGVDDVDEVDTSGGADSAEVAETAEAQDSTAPAVSPPPDPGAPAGRSEPPTWNRARTVGGAAATGTGAERPVANTES